MIENNFVWFAGIDRGSERNQTCLVDAQDRIVGEREFPHGGAGLAELCDWLLSNCGAADTVAVGIEVPYGPVVDTLIDRGFVLHAINPKQLDRLRDRHSMAGAKDDRRDVYVLADGVRTDRRLFRRVHVSDPRLVELRAWSRLAEELTEERVRLGNRVHHELWRYYPQMLTIADDDVAALWILDLWALAPTPAKARRLRVAPVERLLKQHRIRRIDADTVLGILREPAIKVGKGVAEAASVHLRSLFARLRVVDRELRRAEAQLDVLCAAIGKTDADSGEGLQPRDVMILRSLPGIGRINLATLLCEGSGPLCRRDYQALRTLCGAAPVTKRSGKSNIAIMRYARTHQIAQSGLSLGPRRHAARPQEPQSLCRVAPTRQIARPCVSRCCRPVAWPRMCAAGTTDAVRSGLRSSQLAARHEGAGDGRYRHVTLTTHVRIEHSP